jgi:hypothetical protein
MSLKPISWLFAILAVAFAQVPARAADQPTFESVWKAVNAKPNIRAIDEPHDIRIEVPDEQAIYFFTKPGQPAYPSVLKRVVVQRGDGASIESDGHCFGDAAAQAAFALLLEKSRAQDAEISDRMRKQH